MKHFFKHFSEIVLVSILFSTSLVYSQVDRSKGPTLVIASSVSGGTVYDQSKTFGFKIGTGANAVGNYVLVTLNYNNSEYLNTTLNTHIKDYNFRKVIILAGKYKTNGSIIIDRWRVPTSVLADDAPTTGSITIEGEGNSTIIENTSADPIFVVKSSYNTIKNMRLVINENNPTTGIQLYQDYANARKVENNVFENIYIGHWNLENIQRTNDNFVGIELKQTQYSNVGYNKFNNISLQSLYTGIIFTTDGITSSWDHDDDPTTPAIVALTNNLNDNIFENISIKDVTKGILFKASSSNPSFMPRVDYNTFQNIAMQTSTWTTNFIENVSGEMNYFNNCKAADWKSLSTRKIFTISNSAIHTTITNSRMATDAIHANTNDLVDNGFNTQLINNYHYSGKMINKIGLDRIPTNTYRSADKSVTEIKGVLKLSASSGPSATQTANPTFGAGKVLTSDANGYATWQTLGSLAWDHIAVKNIKMDGFALTNHSNATPATNTDAGLRLDNNGNVRIGTVAPFTTNPAKLQVDGRVIVGESSQNMNDYDPTYKLLVNGKVRVRNEVFVQQGGLTWPDYVFTKDYKLMPLQEVEQHIKEKGHLPNMPSAAEVEKDGIAVGDIITRQQEKIEELTLHLIEMHKKIEALEKKLNN